MEFTQKRIKTLRIADIDNKITGNMSDAEDIVQEAFLRAYEKAPEFESGEHEKAWLIRVTVNLCKSRLRSPWRKRIVRLLDSYPASEPEQHELLEQIITLPPKYRTVIHLFYYEGYSIIQSAPGEVVLDYRFDVETKSSNVLGTAVTAGCFETKPNSKGLKNVIYFATFKLSDVAYYVELGGAEAKKEALKNEISEIIGLLIEGGAADLDVFHPVVPELREDRMSLDEAYADIDFGAYLPTEIPRGFVFEDAVRSINQVQNALFVNWTKGMGYITWRVSFMDENDKTRITSVADTKNYDLALYPIPRADSVPEEVREIVDNPIFLIDELTLGVVQARTYETADAGDEPGQRMRFSVLYEDVLVELSVKGASPEVIFDILQQIKK